MKLKQCLLIKNECYKTGTKAKMTGIVVHDTGVSGNGNTDLKRYVQPVEGQEHYTSIIEDIGKNKNGNHWNQGKPEGWTRTACVHYFIGKNYDGEVETYQTLPLDICAWGVGDGKKGSYNYNPQARIQFEICNDGYMQADYKTEYFHKAMKEAQELCAHLCKLYGWDSSRICCHWEAYEQGYGGAHSDITGWLAAANKAEGTTKYTMDWFRNEVQKLLDNESEVEDLTKEETLNLINQNKEKVYHYYTELPAYARETITALHKGGVFTGNGAGDMNLGKTKMEILYILAKQGIFGDKYK